MNAGTVTYRHATENRFRVVESHTDTPLRMNERNLRIDANIHSKIDADTLENRYKHDN